MACISCLPAEKLTATSPDLLKSLHLGANDDLKVYLAFSCSRKVGNAIFDVYMTAHTVFALSILTTDKDFVKDIATSDRKSRPFI